MVSVEEGIRLVKINLPNSTYERIYLSTALNKVLSQDVISKINMPSFNQSSMDGYAVNFSDEIKSYKLVGEIAAGGSASEFDLRQGEAVRIFTGAKVPKGTNTVIQQEIVHRKEKTISFTEPVHNGKNIRLKGEQTTIGQIAMNKGDRITPAAIGFLAGLGITEVDVFKNPTLSIIATGDELVKPGDPLPEGKIYESNAIMLDAAIKQSGYECIKSITVEDTYGATKSAIENLLSSSDVILISGGISVGDYDFVGDALKEIGVKEIFYKVKQKPGKPLFFGSYNDKLVFALPGNPAAALSCFYIYVLTALEIISGKSDGLEITQLKLIEDYSKKGGRAQFLKAKIEGDRVRVLEGQSSSMLHTFSGANGLVYVPENSTVLEANNLVSVYKLP